MKEYNKNEEELSVNEEQVKGTWEPEELSKQNRK